MTKKVIHVGIGSFGRRWCREFLGNNIADGTVEVVDEDELQDCVDEGLVSEPLAEQALSVARSVQSAVEN